MRALMFICLLAVLLASFVYALPAIAQEPPARAVREASPPSLVAPLPARTAPEIKEEFDDAAESRINEPRIDSVQTHCLSPGGRMNIQGQELQNAVLEINGQELVVLSRSGRHLMTRLPQDKLESGRRYALYLNGKDSGAYIQICDTAQKASAKTGRTEILIYARENQIEAVLAELARRDMNVKRRNDLQALGHVIFVVTGNADLADELQAALPETAVDMNEDLSAAHGPRLYAKDMMGWPEAETPCITKMQNDPIKVGLIDGAVDSLHPAFIGRNLIQENFLNNTAAANKTHGTEVASVISGSARAEGFDGLLPRVNLYNAVALRQSGDEMLAATDAVLRGLDWLLLKEVRLIGAALAGRKNRVLIRGFESALARGAVIFAAVGNEGPASPVAYPAAMEGVFAVTAIDAAGRTYRHASGQKNAVNVSVIKAPGVDIWVAQPGGGGAYRSGTSYAVPHALAAASLALQTNPRQSAALLRKTFPDTLKDLSALFCSD